MALEGAPSGCLRPRDQTVWLTPDPTLLHSPLDRSPLDQATAAACLRSLPVSEAAACGHCRCLSGLTLAQQALRASPCGLWALGSSKGPHSALKAVQSLSVQRAFSDATVQPPCKSLSQGSAKCGAEPANRFGPATCLSNINY